MSKFRFSMPLWMRHKSHSNSNYSTSGWSHASVVNGLNELIRLGSPLSVLYIFSSSIFSRRLDRPEGTVRISAKRLRFEFRVRFYHFFIICFYWLAWNRISIVSVATSKITNAVDRGAGFIPHGIRQTYAHNYLLFGVSISHSSPSFSFQIEIIKQKIAEQL